MLSVQCVAAGLRVDSFLRHTFSYRSLCAHTVLHCYGNSFCCHALSAAVTAVYSYSNNGDYDVCHLFSLTALD